jgi:hypothetical protein
MGGVCSNDNENGYIRPSNGRLKCRAGPTSGLGFQAIQKIATIHANSGVIWDITVQMKTGI